MEVSPLAIALIGILGSILTFMISILLAMLFGMKKEQEKRTSEIFKELRCIRDRLSEMLPIDDYKVDKREVDIKLDEHGQKILRLEIKVINGGAK